MHVLLAKETVYPASVDGQRSAGDGGGSIAAKEQS